MPAISIEKVRAYFRSLGIEEKVMEFDVSSATVELAARALGCEPCRIAKTLSFHVRDRVILAVLAGDARIDNKKYKALFGVKAKMLSPEETGPRVGYDVGGVCPFAINEGADVYLDQSLKRFRTVFPSCGSSSSAIELSIPELESYARTKGWVDISKV